ncbi:MAG: 50S ribosomal protein L13 [Candidatus Pacearchaeota archaeon]|nr:50S ribosomal protein L13 [Candidatus Pacearchaeota archaeon]
MGKTNEKNREIVIDAKGAIVGRLSTFVAKKALQGNTVVVLNSEEAIISGRKGNILKDYLSKFRLGHGAQRGPLFSRKPEKILRRAIRGMIGYKSSRGREAFRRVKCYAGIPEEYIGAERIQLRAKEPPKFITLNELGRLIKPK